MCDHCPARLLPLMVWMDAYGTGSVVFIGLDWRSAGVISLLGLTIRYRIVA